MKRSELISQLAAFLDTFPEGCSNYHICDMLIRRAEKLGMMPPEVSGYVVYNEEEGLSGHVIVNVWEEEDD